MDDLKAELQSMNESQQSELANSLKEINELANQAYEAKTVASEYDQKAKDLKNKLSSLMETAGVDKISADNCTVSGKVKQSCSVPKEVSAKLELFKYIASKDNEGVVSEDIKGVFSHLLERYPTLFSMLTINSTSFNSWYAKEVEAQIAEGNIDFKLDFLNIYEYYSVGFRKKAVKK